MSAITTWQNLFLVDDVFYYHRIIPNTTLCKCKALLKYMGVFCEIDVFPFNWFSGHNFLNFKVNGDTHQKPNHKELSLRWYNVDLPSPWQSLSLRQTFCSCCRGDYEHVCFVVAFFSPNNVKLFLAVCLVWVTCLRRWVCRLLVGPHVLEVVRSDMKGPQVWVNSRLVQPDGWAACGSTAAPWCVMCGGCFRHSDVWQDKAWFVDLHWTFNGPCLPAWYTSLWKWSCLSQ